MIGAGCMETMSSGSESGQADNDTYTLFNEIDIGSQSEAPEAGNTEPHQVRVRNGAPRSQGISITVDSEARESSLLEQSYSFPSDGSLKITIFEPASYVVRVATGDGDQRESITVGERWFDCNYTTHTATVPERGEISVTTSGTLRACSQ